MTAIANKITTLDWGAIAEAFDQDGYRPSTTASNCS